MKTERETIKKEDVAVICSVCNSVRNNEGKWIPKGSTYYHFLTKNKMQSHGYCPPCAEDFSNEIKRYVKEIKK